MVSNVLLWVLAGWVPCGIVQEPDPGKKDAGNRAVQDQEGEKAGQEPERPERGETIVITATRWKADPFFTPRAVTVIDERRLGERNPFTVTDALDDQVGLWIERRTSTTGDPHMRGFAGSNLLALIDGNTLSTLWGEGGEGADDMYGKIDPDMIGRIEVVRGPGSVLYGSNAIGGVLNFLTRDIEVPFPKEGMEWGTRTSAGFGSAAQYLRLRQEISLAFPSLRFRVGASRHESKDVRGGRGVGVMKPTRGEDVSADGKVEILLGDRANLELSVQDTRRDPVFRYYRPAQTNRNDRTGVAATLSFEPGSGWADKVQARLYFQDKKDYRNWFADPTLTTQEATGVAKWRTWSAGFQARTPLHADHRLTWGVAYERDDGESPDDEQFTITYLTDPTPPGPPPDIDWTGRTVKNAPDSVWEDVGLFLQHEWSVSPRLNLTASLRFDRMRIQTDVDPEYEDYPLFIQDQQDLSSLPWDPAIDEIDEREWAVTGGAAVLYQASEEIHLTLSWFRGFRFWPPRFGVVQLGSGIQVPSGQLPPVKADTFEAGVKVRSEKVFKGAAFLYYTSLRDNQILVPGTFNGSAYYDWDGDGINEPGEEVRVWESGGRAYVYGVELEGVLTLHSVWEAVPESWSLRFGFTWNIGKDEETQLPIRRTQPARFLVDLRWDGRDSGLRPWLEAAIDIVRHYDRLGVPDAREWWRDPADSTSGFLREDGLPGYTVYSLRGGIEPVRGLSIGIAVENLTDKRFRTAHSRWVSAPGTSVQIGITVSDEIFSRNP